jgi:hypothetical protein
MSDVEIKRINERLVSIEKRISLLEGVPGQHEKREGKVVPIKQFIISKNPKDDNQKTLAIGCYLQRNQGLVSFNTKDLCNGFEKANEKHPTNINDKVNVNIKLGFMSKAKRKKDGQKAWYVTNKGERFVEGNFEKTEQ